MRGYNFRWTRNLRKKMDKKKIVSFLTTLLYILLTMQSSTPAHAGRIYKWKDKNGVMQFSTLPPLDSQKESSAVDIPVNKSHPDVSTAITGKWEVKNNRGMVASVDIREKFIHFSFKEKKSKRSKIKSGNYILNNKTIEVIYSRHYDKSMVGKVEKYRVSLTGGNKLTLYSTNIKETRTYHKNKPFGKDSSSLSIKARQLLGTWESGNKERKITFIGSDFFIEEKPDKYRGRYRKVMQGGWQFNDPYIILQATHEREDTHTKLSITDKQYKLYLFEMTDVKLKIRNESSKVELFFKQ